MDHMGCMPAGTEVGGVGMRIFVKSTQNPCTLYPVIFGCKSIAAQFVWQLVGGPCSKNCCRALRVVVSLSLSRCLSKRDSFPPRAHTSLLTVIAWLCPVFFVTMSSLRTLAPFLRTARTSLRSGHPLIALQRQSTSPVLNLRRGYAVYERTKPHVNIGQYGRGAVFAGAKADNLLDRHDRSCRPRKGTSNPFKLPPRATRLTSASRRPDHTVRCHHKETSRERLCKLPRLWLHRQGPRGAQARHHHRHCPHRVLHRCSPLLPRRLPGPRRLHQEHDHWCRQHGRCHHRRRGL